MYWWMYWMYLHPIPPNTCPPPGRGGARALAARATAGEPGAPMGGLVHWIAGCIGNYTKIRRMYQDVFKNIVEINILIQLPIHWMYWKLARWIEVYWDMYWIYWFRGWMYWMMYLMCIESRQEVSSEVLGDVCTDMYWKIAGCTVGCIADPIKDVLDVLRFGSMYWAMHGGMYWDVMIHARMYWKRRGSAEGVVCTKASVVTGTIASVQMARVGIPDEY